MSLEIQLRSTARKQISDAVDWYNKQQHGLGDRYFYTLEAELQFIAKYPKSFSIKYTNIRMCKVTKFPYMIHYAENISENTLIIFAVIHAATRPQNWKKQ